MSSVPTQSQLNDAIAVAATTPQKGTVDGTTIEARDIDQLIKASNHLAAQAAKASPGRGFGFGQVVNGGAA